MLRLFSTFAAPVALVLVGILLLEPPALTPGDRVPTLRLLTGSAPGRGEHAASSDAVAPYLGRWRVDLDAIERISPRVEPLMVTITTRGSSVWITITNDSIGTVRSAGQLRENALVTSSERRRASGGTEQSVTRYRALGDAMTMERTVSGPTGAVTTTLPLVRAIPDKSGRGTPEYR